MTAIRGMAHGPKHPWFDDSRAPIIVMRVPEIIYDRELTSALETVTRWLLEEVDALFGFVADFARPQSISAKQRKMMADAELAYKHVDYAFNAGQALVVRSTVIRGVLTAIFWLSPPVYPYAFFGELEPALQWLGPQLHRFAIDHPTGRGATPG